MSITILNTISTSPQIAKLPKKIAMRLIDNGMLHYEASLAGLAERYGRGETSHTIHVWWARRPHSAMRALVFASLCKENSQQAIDILKQLSCASVASPEIITKARSFLLSQYDEPPRLLDMFGGGGTIPMEAANLGAKTYAIDANQLSVFIQCCNLVYSQAVTDKDITRVIKSSGTRVLKQLAEETEPLFPLRAKMFVGYDAKSVYGYYWTYTMKCPSCGYQFYLSKRPWLSKKNGKSIALLIENGDDKQTATIGDLPKGYKVSSVWCGKNGSVQCPKCEAKHSNINVQHCQDELVVLVRPANGRGKEFLLPVINSCPPPSKIEKIEQTILTELGVDLPQSTLPRWSGIVNPAIYGIHTHADFLSRRQRVVLLLLVKALRDEYKRLKTEYGEAASQYIIGLLSSLVDQLVDWNCRFSMWIPQNEQVGRAFCGPGVSMFWDYMETDPVLNGPANLWAKLNRIVSGAKSILQFLHVPDVRHGYAQALPYPDEFFDAIVTDPPYYDNIYYNVLADFFYAWKRLLLQSIEPELFASLITDSSRELVASKFRSGTHEKAHEDYCTQLTLALKEAERVLKPEGVFSFIYSHSSLKGWEAIIRAYRATNFRIASVQPLSIERRQRPRAMTSEAVNTCITFVAHKSRTKKSCLSLDELKLKLRKICEEFAPKLIAAGWNETDTALAVFANGVGMLANANAISGCTNDIESLRTLESVVKEKLPSFSVKDRKSL